MVEPVEVVQAIISEQSQIIGEYLARQVVQSTGAVSFAEDGNPSIQLRQEPQQAVSSLIDAYGNVFGQASINVCLDVIKRFPKNEVAYMLPDNLK